MAGESWEWELEIRWNCKMAIDFLRTLLRFMVGVGLCSTRGALRHHKALAGEHCSPLLYNRKSGGGFAPGLESFACRGLHCRPANGAEGGFWGCGCGWGGVFGVGCGGDFRGCGCGTRGRSQAPPLQWNCKMAIKILRTLLRCIVGVGLCSTRGALRQHKVVAGEQCSPLLYNRKERGCFAWACNAALSQLLIPNS